MRPELNTPGGSAGLRRADSAPWICVPQFPRVCSEQKDSLPDQAMSIALATSIEPQLQICIRNLLKVSEVRGHSMRLPLRHLNSRVRGFELPCPTLFGGSGWVDHRGPRSA